MPSATDEVHVHEADGLALLRALTASLDEGVLLVDDRGVLLHANAAVAALGGGSGRRLAPNEPLALDWAEILDVEGRVLPPERLPLFEALRSGRPLRDVPLGLRRPDRTIWLNTSALPVDHPTEPGRRAVLVVLSEVRHELAEPLGPVDQRTVLAAAYDGSPAAMVIARHDGAIVHRNPAYGRLLPDWSPGDRTPWWSFLDPGEQATLAEHLQARRAGAPTPPPLECRGRAGDGTPLVVRITITPVTGASGLLCVELDDVTELRQSEQRYRALTETVPVGIFELDNEGCFTYANPTVQQLLGREDLLGLDVIEFIPPDHREAALIAYREALAGRPWFTGQRIVTSTGEQREVLTVGRPMLDAGGAVVGILAMVADFTDHLRLEARLEEADRRYESLAAQRERERLEAQLAQAQRFEALGRLAGGVAHDFNNLLGVISNYAGFLRRRPELPASLRRDVDQIAEASRRGAELTRQLLLFSRREQLRPQRFDLSRVVLELGALLSRPLEPHVQLHIDAPPGLHVEADPGQIEQALVNLLLNARDALPGGGRIVLRARLEATEGGRGEVVVEVVDDGTGIEADVLERVFEPFFTTKPRSEASGLGLATVQGIVEQAGGVVLIHSTPGAGTRVELRLPAG